MTDEVNRFNEEYAAAHSGYDERARLAEADAAHKAAQLKDEAIRWRQWAIEKLLASPTLATINATNLWVLAEAMIAYVTTGEHPGGEGRS